MAELLGGLASARARGDGSPSDAALAASREHLIMRLRLGRAA
jgi:hypothetical protein